MTLRNRATSDGLAGGSCLGLMVKRPVPGKVKTRLHPPLTPESAARLYAAFVADLMAEFEGAAESSVLVLDGEPKGNEALPESWAAWPVLPQRGGDLGQRLAAAFEDLEVGRRPVVLVGGDHPDLPRAEVEDAFLALASNDLVLGPTVDGGYYLIGLARPEPALFSRMPWSTPGLLRATLDCAAALRLKVAAVRPWYDVDRPQDIAFLREHLRLLKARDPQPPRPRLLWTAAALRDCERELMVNATSNGEVQPPAGS